MACSLEIGDVAKRTCINAYYFKAMEEGRFHVIPKVFDKGYLKIYANLLDMETQPLLTLHEKNVSKRFTSQFDRQITERHPSGSHLLVP